MRFMVSMVLLLTLLVGCATNYQVQGKIYDSVVVTATADSIIVTPSELANAELIRSISTNLVDLTKMHVTRIGNVQVKQECGPKTLRVASSLRSLSFTGSYEISGGMFGFHAGRENKTFLSVTGNFIDCVSGQVIGSFEHSEEGENIFEIVSDISKDTAKDTYQQILEKEKAVTRP